MFGSKYYVFSVECLPPVNELITMLRVCTGLKDLGIFSTSAVAEKISHDRK